MSSVTQVDISEQKLATADRSEHLVSHVTRIVKWIMDKEIQARLQALSHAARDKARSAHSLYILFLEIWK